jgi:hypothetical protein
MNREVHVRFREEQGVKSPLLTRLAAGILVGGLPKFNLIDFIV